MKKLLILFLVLAMSIGSVAFSASAWNSDFTELAIDIQYDAEGATLTVSGVTPAKYGQQLMVVAYNPKMADGLTAELRAAKDPSELEPLATPEETKVFRLEELRADKNGNFSGQWPLNAGVNTGNYIIVKVSGTGKIPVQASKLFYFESSEHFQEVTLRQFEDFTGDSLGQLLVDKKLLLGTTKEDSYYLDDQVEAMFAAIRDNDFEADPVTGNLFNEKNDIIVVLGRVEALQKFPASPEATDVAYLIRDYGYLMNYDFSSANNDYTLKKSEAQKIAAGIFKEDAPECFSDIDRVVEQSVGLSMLNSKDSTTIAPVIAKYATILGLDTTDYELYCEKYTSYEVNKAFVGHDFKKPADVLTSLADRISVLEAEANKPSGGGSGGGGGGSFGGSSSRPVEGSTKPIGTVESPTEKDEPVEDAKTKYSDVPANHWASEAVNALSEKKVINGFEDGSFRPDDSVTREQFVKMLVEAFTLTGSGNAAFSDVASDRWSYSVINTAVASGIVNGIGDGVFAPANSVSRQDAAVMLARLCDNKGIQLKGPSSPVDNALISDYAKESVAKLYGSGVISGFEDGSFRPAETLTRAQAAKLIFSLLQKYGG